MPRAEVGTPKFIANKMKAKGLQRLRWYCQVCEKQCRDENGFKCHAQSEGHLRQMLVVGEHAGKHIADYSSQFQHDFVQLLSQRHSTNRVKANNVYQEYIQDRNHLHMNATRWVTLTEFVKHLGRSGIARVDETEKGWFIAWIDNSPKALAKQEASMKKERSTTSDEQRERMLIAEQIERAQADQGESGSKEPSPPVELGLKREDPSEKVVLSLAPKAPSPSSDAPSTGLRFNPLKSATNPLKLGSNPLKAASNPLKRTNVFKQPAHSSHPKADDEKVAGPRAEAETNGKGGDGCLNLWTLKSPVAMTFRNFIIGTLSRKVCQPAHPFIFNLSSLLISMFSMRKPKSLRIIIRPLSPSPSTKIQLVSSCPTAVDPPIPISRLKDSFMEPLSTSDSTDSLAEHFDRTVARNEPCIQPGVFVVFEMATMSVSRMAKERISPASSNRATAHPPRYLGLVTWSQVVRDEKTGEDVDELVINLVGRKPPAVSGLDKLCSPIAPTTKEDPTTLKTYQRFPVQGSLRLAHLWHTSTSHYHKESLKDTMTSNDFSLQQFGQQLTWITTLSHDPQPYPTADFQASSSPEAWVGRQCRTGDEICPVAARLAIRNVVLLLEGLRAACGVVTHAIFKYFEPSSAVVHAALLIILPLLLSALLVSHLHPLNAVITTLATFNASLCSSLVLYRLSPFHPYYKFPGPLPCKITKFWLAWTSSYGKQHIYIRRLHEKYGDIVRIGPNEISIRDVNLINAVMGSQGLPKGPNVIARSFQSDVIYLLGLRDPHEHFLRRKPWSRALNMSAIKEFQPVLTSRVAQLVESIGKQEGVFDLSRRIGFFTFDFMCDMVFGGGSEMIRDGDPEDYWTRMENALDALRWFEHLPWLADYAKRMPPSTQAVSHVRAAGIKRIEARKRDGAFRKDLMYSLEGILAIVAGSDTTSGALSNVFYFLMSNPDIYKRLQGEVDLYYPPGEDSLDPKYYPQMAYLEAVLNETLRLMPAVASGSLRAPLIGSGGKLVGPHYIPEGNHLRVHFYSVQRDPRNFTDPDKFWPDRWLIAEGLMEWKGQSPFIHNPNAFLPFSHGPANCVGKPMAMHEMRTVTCHMMQKLDLRFAGGWDPKDWERDIEDRFVLKHGRLLVTVQPR
ncbi:hypothetical protein NM688_g1609 [Phlebia brevispora]|uniref:Uncharacterized protein n=1 Tax=Phlebia brevispora TaxID=194682 RepID=A0ACC1TAU2_9APHY|nr:hypothetical protein NM688_g1609 [Phlebia brevispora]